MKRLREQTIPPDRIIVWHDYGIEQVEVKIPGVECINSTNDSWQSFPQMAMAWFANTDYVAILDDDKPPGKKWFEHALKLEEQEKAIYGCFGYRIKNSQDLYRNLEYHETRNSKDDSVAEVDMVGQSYFFPAEYAKFFFMEKPPFYRHTNDLHLAYTCSKYGNVKGYVVYSLDPEERPECREEELILDERQHAEHHLDDHKSNRTEYVIWAVQNGWKLKWNKD